MVEPKIIVFIRGGKVVNMFGVGEESPPIAVVFLHPEPPKNEEGELVPDYESGYLPDHEIVSDLAENPEFYTYTQDGTVNSASEIQL